MFYVVENKPSVSVVDSQSENSVFPNSHKTSALIYNYDECYKKCPTHQLVL